MAINYFIFLFEITFRTISNNLLLFFHILLRGGPLEIPGGGGGIKFLRHDFFSVSCLCRIFFYAFNLCKNFFSRLFTLCCLLARFFFLLRNGCTNFFSLHEFVFGNFHPPPPGISNGPPLTEILQIF